MVDEAATPIVTVAIVAYQAGAFLQRCVNGLAAQTFSGFEAIILDNASIDGSISQLRLPAERFRIESLGKNLGFAAANNIAARVGRGTWLATLNPDAIPHPDWLACMMQGITRWPHAASFGSTQLSLERPDVLDGAGDVWHAAGLAWRGRSGWPATSNPDEGEIFGPCAAAALYRRDIFLMLGGFDESFFCYCEDLDLAYRLRLAGYTSMQIPSAVVRHVSGGISGEKSDFTLFHGHRNRIWTFVKNTPGAGFWALLPWHIAIDAVMLYGGYRDRKAAPIARGYIAAIKGLPAIWQTRRQIQSARRASTISVLKVMGWGLLSFRTRDVVPRRRAGKPLAVRTQATFWRTAALSSRFKKPERS